MMMTMIDNENDIDVGGDEVDIDDEVDVDDDNFYVDYDHGIIIS